MKTALMSKWILRAVSASVLFLTFQSAFAEDRAATNETGGDQVLRAPAAAASNAVSRKRYPGGADEDDLQMQATLPIPSRTLDGSPVTLATGESAESQTPPPATD